MLSYKRVFLSYFDDNDKVISGYVHLVESTNTRVVFVTGKNRLTIPISRLIKLKEVRANG